MKKMLSIVGLVSGSLIMGSVAFASPQYLTTHNRTNVESNAYVDGSIPSPHPTKANSDGKVLWALVKLACFGHTKNDRCTALVKMDTASSHPVILGNLSMNLSTGDITPKTLRANGYALTVNAPGEVTLSYAK